MLIAGSLYVVIRNLMAENDIFDSAKSGQKFIVINSLVCGVVVAAVNAGLNDNLFKLGILNRLLIVFITFVRATISSFAVLKLFSIVNKKDKKH